MKAVILAGGLGTRLSEETDLKPKPMVEIGGMPILWHIMKVYAAYGITDFIILCGYKSYQIKEYFHNYFLHRSDITVFTAKNHLELCNNVCEDWKVTLIDTGLDTMTGGRLLRAQKYIGDEPFHLTYGDGVSNVNLELLMSFHKKHKKILTMTSIQPEGRFGVVEISNDHLVKTFSEKPKGDNSWVNGGFFICNKEIFKYLNDGDSTVFERDPLEQLSKESQICAYKHYGFWKCMDTLRDKNQLIEMWNTNKAPWKIWE